MFRLRSQQQATKRLFSEKIIIAIRLANITRRQSKMHWIGLQDPPRSMEPATR